MSKIKVKSVGRVLLFIILGVSINTLALISAVAQEKTLTLNQSVDMAMENNLEIKTEELKLIHSKQLISSAIDIGKTKFYYENDEKSIAPNNLPIVVWGVQQEIKFPTKYIAKHKFLKHNIKVSERHLEIKKNRVKKEVSKKYLQVVYIKEKLKKQRYMDSLYISFTNMVREKFDAGEISKLEKTNAEYKYKGIQLELINLKEQLNRDKLNLQQVINSSIPIDVSQTQLYKLKTIPYDSVNNPLYLYYDDVLKLKNKKIAVNKHELLPDVIFSIFRGLNNGIEKNRFDGFKIGLSIPLWYGIQKSNIKTSKTEKQVLENEYQNTRTKLAFKHQSLMSDLNRYENELKHYLETGKKLQEELLLYAKESFISGDISYIIFLQLFEQANAIEIKYINSLYQYNNIALDINFLLD